MHFGFEKESAPVGEFIKQQIDLVNSSDTKFCWKVFPPANAKFQLTTSPESDSISPVSDLLRSPHFLRDIHKPLSFSL